ncbi:hypothetical protein C5F62_13075 [Photobacterium damselae subsp. damselae]|nr:hypothetical protein C5F62_13075 [Photobacterium damselae subsp. damselae]
MKNTNIDKSLIKQNTCQIKHIFFKALEITSMSGYCQIYDRDKYTEVNKANRLSDILKNRELLDTGKQEIDRLQTDANISNDWRFIEIKKRPCCITNNKAFL